MSQRAMIDGYDTAMQGAVIEAYYGSSDFYNFGFWSADTGSQSQASEALVARLLEFIPPDRRGGRILDVACGLGASSRHLLRHFAPRQIVGINVSERQLERARHNAPGCEFRVMDATALEFPDASFDNILCVEAAFHFDTRAAFLREALRVLKPGGRLVHSDILMAPLPQTTSARTHIPNANAMSDPAELERAILAAGFARAEVVDATEQCWTPFLRSVRRFKAAHKPPGPSTPRTRRSAPIFFNPEYLARFIRRYVLACSHKSAD
ncbi:class I SAM-dependent methyltransferase [Lysobacter enzymogenes]|uniref:Class I SAM-dependent methyltransferase n=1 Tax=Lysobacter enzymogenes TaxID=69 RepID=A0A3N2RFP5_LYSEN|nr:class I SAM-dependent methyltransferase [Lysobacter enzymogenes]ROU06229.1 class I SAM-dependent methyltransferase [Lysobacter enzymogenes]